MISTTSLFKCGLLIALMLLPTRNMNGQAAKKSGPQDPLALITASFKSKSKGSLGPDATVNWANLSVFVAKKALSRKALETFNSSDVNLNGEIPNKAIIVSKPTLVSTDKISDECRQDHQKCVRKCGSDCDRFCEAEGALTSWYSLRPISSLSFNDVSIQGTLKVVNLKLDESENTLRLNGRIERQISLVGKISAKPELANLCKPLVRLIPATQIESSISDVSLRPALSFRELKNSVSIYLSAENDELETNLDGTSFVTKALDNLPDLLGCTIPFPTEYRVEKQVDELNPSRSISLLGHQSLKLGALSIGPHSKGFETATRSSGPSIGLVRVPKKVKQSSGE